MEATEDETLEALNSMGLADLRYRAAVVTDLSLTDASFAGPTSSYRVDGATRYANNDSGGQSVIWYFTDDGRALLLTFVHDDQLNSASPGDDFDLLRSFYRGVPEDLLRLAGDRTKAYENYLVEDPTTGAGLLLATGVLWCGGDRWQVADGLLEYCEMENIDLGEVYVGLESYLPGQDFTPETYIDDYFWYDGWNGPDRETLLSQIRPVFERHRGRG